MTLAIKIRKFYNTRSSGLRGITLLVICLLFVSFCESTTSSQQWSGVCPYTLDKPDAEYKLPSYLEEISGISYYGNNKIACVQDEKANIYVLDLGKDLKISKYDFGSDGDYEDIALVGETAFVLRNDGQIFRVENFRKKDRKVTKYKTPLSSSNNTEGMAYDSMSNTLLIACKASPSIGEENLYKGCRAVYQFDLATKDLAKEPHFLIDLGKLEIYKDQSTFTRFSLILAEKLRMVDSYTSFMPSGIAIHPLCGDIYILSSIGKLLIVIDRRGKVLDIQDLDIKLFRQPEGICFSPSGDLFISNEGQGGRGYILKFKPLKNE